MFRWVGLVSLAILCVCGCARQTNFQSQTNPLFEHAKVEGKRAYLASARKTLYAFEQIAGHFTEVGDPQFLQLGAEADFYIKEYVIPILNDEQVSKNLEDQPDVAQLQLLTSLVYYRFGERRKAREILAFLDSHCKGKAPPMDAGPEFKDYGFSTVQEGCSFLNQKTTPSS